MHCIAPLMSGKERLLSEVRIDKSGNVCIHGPTERGEKLHWEEDSWLDIQEFHSQNGYFDESTLFGKDIRSCSNNEKLFR